MRCKTAVAILASEGLALVSVSRQQARELVRAFLFSREWRNTVHIHPLCAQEQMNLPL